jgi:hypothetical protein
MYACGVAKKRNSQTTSEEGERCSTEPELSTLKANEKEKEKILHQPDRVLSYNYMQLSML